MLRFNNFKHAYYARQKLVEQLKYEPRSFVSFDTKRSVFHNGKHTEMKTNDEYREVHGPATFPLQPGKRNGYNVFKPK